MPRIQLNHTISVLTIKLLKKLICINFNVFEFKYDELLIMLLIEKRKINVLKIIFNFVM